MAGEQLNELSVLAASVTSWQELGRRYGDRIKAIQGSTDQATAEERAAAIDLLLQLGDLAGARQAVVSWLLEWFRAMPLRGSGRDVLQPELLRCLADVVERSSDQALLQLFWQGLERLLPPSSAAGVLPLVGVPVLNRPDLLEALISSLDLPVDTMAIVDNSGGRDDSDALELRHLLKTLEEEPPAGIGQVRVARAFGNGGVAAAWNQILLGFPQAAVALIVNNDVVMAPGVLTMAMERIDLDRPQILSLLPGPAAFSAFLITALAWDRIGLFDEGFYPAYCEDLDYLERVRGCADLEWIGAEDLHRVMAPLNTSQSATISSDPSLAAANHRSFQLNRLWSLYQRRPRLVGSAQWRRRWLSQWS